MSQIRVSKLGFDFVALFYFIILPHKNFKHVDRDSVCLDGLQTYKIRVSELGFNFVELFYFIIIPHKNFKHIDRDSVCLARTSNVPD